MVYSKPHGKNFGLHRLTLANKLGVDVRYLVGVAMHTCDNKRCINPDHLELGTHSQNITDAYARGLAKAARGELHHSSKLTDLDVALILGSDKGARELGRLFGVSHSVISRLRNGKARVAQRVG